MAIAVAPMAGVFAFETASVTETLPVVGQREFTFSPNLHSSVTVDTGMGGKLRAPLDSKPFGLDIEVGHAPISSAGQAEAEDFGVLSTATQTILRLNGDTLKTSAELIKQDLERELLVKFLYGELGGLAVIGAHNLLRKNKRYSAALIGGLSLTSLPVYGVFAEAQPPEAWAAISTPLGVVYSNDAVTTALVRKASSGAENLNKKRLKNNERYEENAFEKTIPFLDEILVNRGENDMILSFETDMHTAEVMTQVGTRSDDYLKPDAKLKGGDMSNINNLFEVATVTVGIDDQGAPTVGIEGNHDGKVIKDAMEKEGAIFPDGTLVTLKNPRTGQSVTLLGMDDPRVTLPGQHGVVERSEGAVADMQAKLLAAAQTLQPDIIMLHEPTDIQFLIDNGVTAKLFLSGHEHMHSIESTPAGEWLKGGDAGGIGVRDITNILTPFGRPATDAHRYYIRYNTELDRVAAIYTLLYSPDGDVSMTTYTPTYPLTIPEKAGDIMARNQAKLNKGEYKASKQ